MASPAERRLVRKIDWHLYPILFLVYTCSFLDRINISNAKIQGMDEDLDLSGTRFNIALFVYFIPYILLEVPSNMLIKKVRPSIYLSGLMAAWGVVNMTMGFVTSYEALVALRFLLGVLEAGVLPGIIYLTSMYYKRHEFQKRMSFFFLSVVVAGAFGGLLAYAIAHLDHVNGMRAWRWIFIIEGAATAAISLASSSLIADWPSQCRFLDADEKLLLRARLAADGADAARMDTLNRDAYKRILGDWKIWLFALAYMGLGITGYAVTFFLPAILREFGWAAAAAQVHTIPVYAATGVFMVAVAWLSDRARHRYLFVVFCVAVATVGYVLLLLQPPRAPLSRDVKYLAVFLAAAGGYGATPVALAWLANNLSGHWKRAFGTGIQVTVGNVAGLVASTVFLQREAPRYRTGYAVALALTWIGALACTALAVKLRRENARRAAGARNYRLDRPQEEVDNMGDDHPSFRFTI
ncbi:major facilitator superfamily domain-containing protein [Xylariomycetidae sp. FL0641]|nr:major facilitator superfamily domain-containing protein [Xylariomycetidae sp. FL0641]